MLGRPWEGSGLRSHQIVDSPGILPGFSWNEQEGKGPVPARWLLPREHLGQRGNFAFQSFFQKVLPQQGRRSWRRPGSLELWDTLRAARLGEGREGEGGDRSALWREVTGLGPVPRRCHLWVLSSQNLTTCGSCPHVIISSVLNLNHLQCSKPKSSSIF